MFSMMTMINSITDKGTGTCLVPLSVRRIVIFLTAGEWTKFFSVLVMIVSIATYYWRLHPITKRLDQKGEITPKGYSKTLDLMIAFFLIMFAISLIVHILKTSRLL